jgi:hypothetical protein
VGLELSPGEDYANKMIGRGERVRTSGLYVPNVDFSV